MSDTTAAASRQPNPVVSVGWKMSAAFAAILLSFLVAGLVMPGAWSAEATADVAAPPESVYALVAAPARWDEWAAWPAMTFTYEGPASGVGATRSWDAPDVGAGSFTVTDAEPPSRVAYQVEVDGGRLVTQGVFRLEATASGTRVTWSEAGDLGGNPLMAWAALSMRRNHGAALALQLEGLQAAAEGG